jgi:hypothetical protein
MLALGIESSGYSTSTTVTTPDTQMFFLSIPLLDMFDAAGPVPFPGVTGITGVTGETGGPLVVICSWRSPSDLLAGGGGVIPCVPVVPLIPTFWTPPMPRPPTDLLDILSPAAPPPVVVTVAPVVTDAACAAGVAVAVVAGAPLILFKLPLPNLDLSFPDGSGRTTTPSLFPKPATRLVESLDTIGWT